MKDQGWIGVDFDKTLAQYQSGGFSAPLGAPIYHMLRRVKEWLTEGREVRIFTARVSHNGTARRMMEASREHRRIEEWCTKHLGCIIPVTCAKDARMDELWDDRAVQVLPNDGRALQEIVASQARQIESLNTENERLRAVCDTRQHVSMPTARALKSGS